MRKEIKTAVIFILFFSLCCAESHAQERRKLEQIRQEIQRLKEELKARKSSEVSLLDQIEDIEREIGLRKKLLHQLERERLKNERDLSVTRERLSSVIKSYGLLRESVAERIISLYKHGRFADWEIFFALKYLSKLPIWFKYQRIIINNDRRNMKLLQEKGREIERQKGVLEAQLRERDILIKEKIKENERLEQKKSDRDRLLKRISSERRSIQEQLKQKLQAFDEISGVIRSKERRRRSSALKHISTNFSSLRGRMMWPVEGRIVQKYGENVNPKTRTVIENIGIDIQAQEEAAVRAVCGGQILYVGWQRGMGNIVMIDHGDGYYTVYGRLEVVFVNPKEMIGEGDIIGRVGDRKSYNGSVLHFEIWKGMDHNNPERWLK